jgi:hypothetical protein
MRRDSPAGTALILIVLLAALVIFMFLVLWMFLTSFKDKAEYFAYPPVFWPKSFSLRNYFNSMAFPPDGRGGLQGFRDSLIIALSSTFALVLIGSLAVYSISRFKTGGENFSFWILSTRMFPPVAAALPLFLIFKELKLLDNHPAPDPAHRSHPYYHRAKPRGRSRDTLGGDRGRRDTRDHPRSAAVAAAAEVPGPWIEPRSSEGVIWDEKRKSSVARTGRLRLPAAV